MLSLLAASRSIEWDKVRASGVKNTRNMATDLIAIHSIVSIEPSVKARRRAANHELVC